MASVRVATIAAFVCGAALMPAAASGQATADGVDSLVVATVAGAAFNGPLDMEGALWSFHSTGDWDDSASRAATQSAPPAARVPPTDLRLAAQSLRIDSHVETSAGSPAAGAPQYHAERLVVTDAHATGQAARQGFLFFVAPIDGAPLPRVEAHAVTAAVEPAAGAAVEPTARVPSDRAALREPGGAAVALVETGLRSIRIEGDFAVMVWEMDWQVRNTTAAQDVVSGYAYQPWAPSLAGVDTVGRYEERQVYLVARGAVLEATMPIGAAVSLSLRPDATAFTGRVAFEHPEGQVTTAAGPAALHDGDWLEGTFAAGFSGFVQDGYGLQLDGTPTAAAVGTSALTFELQRAAFPWWSAAVLAAAVGAGAVAWMVHRSTGVRAADGVKRAMDAGDYAAVVAMARPGLLRRRRHGDAVRTQLTVALLLLGRTEEAGQSLARWRRGHEATRDYLWACVHAARGEPGAAAQRLKACATRDPDLARQLLRDPLMATVARAPVADMRRTYGADGYV